VSFKADAKTEWNGPEAMRDFDRANFRALTKGSNLVLNDAKTGLEAVDQAQLLNSLDKQVTKDNAVVGTNVEHAPYIEFGTRPHRAPFKAISDWVDRKGIDPKAAWPIWKKIAKEGTKAKPFLLPALTGNIRKIIAIFKAEGIKLKWVDKRKGFKR